MASNARLKGAWTAYRRALFAGTSPAKSRRNASSLSLPSPRTKQCRRRRRRRKLTWPALHSLRRRQARGQRRRRGRTPWVDTGLGEDHAAERCATSTVDPSLPCQNVLRCLDRRLQRSQRILHGRGADALGVKSRDDFGPHDPSANRPCIRTAFWTLGTGCAYDRVAETHSRRLQPPR